MKSRREYIALLGSSSTIAIAGCTGGGPSDLGSGPSDDSGESDDGDVEENSDDEAVDDEGNEDDEGEQEPVDPRLNDDLEDVFTEMRWFETEYGSAEMQHRNQVGRAVEALRDVLHPLQDFEVVTTEEFDESAEIVRDASEKAMEALEPQFENVYNFVVLNRNRLPDIRRYLEVDDWDAAEEELEDLIRIHRAVSHERAINDRYSESPIDNRLYDWLGGDLLFEIRHVGDDVNHRNTGDDTAGYGRFILEDSETDVRHDALSDIRPYAPLIEFRNGFDVFRDDEGRNFEIYIRAHDVDVDQDTIDPRDIDESALVFVQRYESPEAAQSAFERIGDRLDVDRELEVDNETWRQIVHRNDEGNRIYGYDILSGKFLITFGLSRTIWDQRDEEYHELLRDTFLLPSSDLDENRIDDGWPF